MVEFVRKPSQTTPPTAGRLFWRSAFPISSEATELVLIILITTFGLFFRLASILQPVGFDEAYTYLAYATQSYGQILTDYSFPNNHIFHTLLVALTSHLIPSQSVWVMRLPALMAGILLIPAVYLAGRSIYRPQVGLIAAFLTAASPLLINYSTEARGYTLVCLMSMIMLWMAGCLAKRSHWTGWLVLTLAGILGAFTIPIMLYPLAAIYVWMAMDATITSEADKSLKRPVWPIFLSALVVLLGTFLVYSPVIFLGTGLKSISSNGFVSPLGWNEFIIDLQNRLQNTWAGWISGEQAVSIWGWIVGLALSFGFHHRLTRSRVHLAIPAAAAISAIVFIQQVAPQPRIWLFMLPWHFLWVGAGWIGLLSMVPDNAGRLITWLIFGVAAVFVVANRSMQSVRIVYPENTRPGVEESVALILADQIQENELIVSVLPSGTQIKYYYQLAGGSLTDYYNTSLTVDPLIKSYLVVVNKKYDETLDTILSKNHLEDRVNPVSAEKVIQYKQVDIYRIPALNTP